MLAVVGSQECTALEYEALLSAAGFKMSDVIELPPTRWSEIEGLVAPAADFVLRPELSTRFWRALAATAGELIFALPV
jgi:hypothetical protein